MEKKAAENNRKTVGTWLWPGGAGRGWLVTAAGRDTPASNSTNHHCHISLVISSLRRQIIPSSMDACVPHCAALRPPTSQDLLASQHPASPALSSLVSNKLCSISIKLPLRVCFGVRPLT
ncbi:unnamed protein product [Pleuronectes platessa]|uniref:Uncharacterized protein n=1 Tax=Pleuronectes platessa TaxID=8262 RepID=A0A9N7UB31_PLEPL|nr:unnamed protein product [Pleuronectes platessa]